MEGVRDDQAQTPQGGVAGGDGQHDDPQQGDDAAHIAQNIPGDDADGLGGQGGIRGLQTQVIHAHGPGGPHHGDKALQHHHVIEGAPASLFAFHGAGDDGGLGGVEAGQNAAGHGDEKDGDKVV